MFFCPRLGNSFFCTRSGLAKGAKRQRPRTTTPIVTILEDRFAPAVLTVNSLVDGPVSAAAATLSLREAVVLVDTGGTASDASGMSLLAAKGNQIDASSQFGSNDVIQFAPNLVGTNPQQIVLTEGSLILDGNVTISGPTTGQVAISGNNQSTVLEITLGASVDIVGLTIENGAASGSSGGGIANAGTLTLLNSVVSDNAASNGGGIANTGTLVIDNSTISGNAATDNGGIFNTGTLTLTQSLISGDTAFVGNGGVANYGGTLTLIDSTVTGNLAAVAGGVGNYENGAATIENSIVTGNSAGSGGGGIFNAATMTLIGSTVTSNEAILGNGGGIVNGGDLTLVNSVVVGNSAQIDGGIVTTGDLSLNDSVVSGNTAVAQNGDLGNYGGAVLQNAGTIVGNPADQNVANNATPTEPANPVSPAESAVGIDRQTLVSTGIGGNADDVATEITVIAFAEQNAAVSPRLDLPVETGIQAPGADETGSYLTTPLLVEFGALGTGELQGSNDWAEGGLNDGMAPNAGSLAFAWPDVTGTDAAITPMDQTLEGGSLDGGLRIVSSTGYQITNSDLNGHIVNGLVDPSGTPPMDVSSPIDTVSFAPANSGLVIGVHTPQMSDTAETNISAASAAPSESPAKIARESRVDQVILADSVDLIDPDSDFFTDLSAANMAGFLLAPWLVIGISSVEKKAAHLQALLERARERVEGIPNEM